MQVIISIKRLPYIMDDHTRIMTTPSLEDCWLIPFPIYSEIQIREPLGSVAGRQRRTVFRL